MEGITGISVLTQVMEEPYILLFSYDLQDDDLRTAAITPTRLPNNVKNKCWHQKDAMILL